MNATAVYSKINEVINNSIWDESTNKYLNIAFKDVMDDCKREIFEASAKLQGGSNKTKRLKSALKYIESIEREDRRGAWKSGEYQCFTNGYTGFLLTDHLDGLEESPASSIELEKCFPDYRYFKDVKIDIGDIKVKMLEHKTANKGKKKVQPYTYIIDGHYFNAKYILDAYSILGGDIKFYIEEGKPLSPAVLESENGKAIILPVHPPKPEVIAES